MPNTYEIIASTTVLSDTISVTFNNLPQTYKHLIIKSSVRSSDYGASDVGYTFRLNNDSTADRYLSANMNSGVGNSPATQFYQSDYAWNFSAMTGTTANTNSFSVSELVILNYSNALYSKSSYSFSAPEFQLAAPENRGLALTTQQYGDNTAITRIDIRGGSGSLNILAGSTFYIYGIKES